MSPSQNGNQPNRNKPRRRAQIAAFALVLMALSFFAHAQQIDRFVIGEVEYFGYAGLNLPRIQAAVPLRAGKSLTVSQMRDALAGTASAVLKLTGHPATDTQPVCCDARGGWFVFVGLPGKSSHPVPYNPAPKGDAKLPPNIVKLYDQTMDALLHAVRSGGKEDGSKGYFLSAEPGLRKKQLAMRAYALKHEAVIIDVLQKSKEDHQREAAADALGYSEQTPAQLAALARASRDPDETVRNNAIRALAVLASSSQKIATEIPASGFIDLIGSGKWEDRNKASLLLETLTRTRNPNLLSSLRRQALTPLIEMARWDPAHAGAPEMILGRIAGIPEEKLDQMLAGNQADAIIHAAKVSNRDR